MNRDGVLYPHKRRLDEFAVLDAAPVRYLSMMVLRVLEMFVRERNCLVLKLVRHGRQGRA